MIRQYIPQIVVVVVSFFAVIFFQNCSAQKLDLQNIDSKELFNIFVKDLLSEQIFVITPKGDVIDLKKDSTPIDFAYKIHTDIGNHCKMAKVNKQIVPLNYCLQSGDVIEITIDKRKMVNKG
jgi:(p)ppGpp synthase/HD superfamily hydrolase